MTPGLTCRTGVEMLMDYLEGMLGSPEREAIAAHVAGCPAVRRVRRQLRADAADPPGRHAAELCRRTWRPRSAASWPPGGSVTVESRVMHVAELWRYPVKSLAGERLAQRGDPARRRRRRSAGPGVRHARTRGHRAGASGSPRVSGQSRARRRAARRWPAVVVAGGGGPDRPGGRPRGAARALPGEERFDVLPLLVATDGAIAALGVDGRRLRPNIVVGGVDGLGRARVARPAAPDRGGGDRRRPAAGALRDDHL